MNGGTASDSGAAPGSGETTLPYSMPIGFEYPPEVRQPAARQPTTAQATKLERLLHPPQLAGSFRPAIEPVTVRFEGEQLDVPYDPAESTAGELRLGSRPTRSPLGELVEAAYVFGGWTRVDSFLWQLRWIGLAVADVPFAALLLTRTPPAPAIVRDMAGPAKAFGLLPFQPPLPRNLPAALFKLPAPAPAEWAFALARDLRQQTAAGMLPDPVRRQAAAARAARLATAFKHKIGELRYEIVTELERIEAEAQRLAGRRLAAARALIVSEGWRTLGTIDGATFEEWEDRHLTWVIRHRASTDVLTALVDLFRSLGPATNRVFAADEALIDEALRRTTAASGRAAVAAARHTGTLAPLVGAATWVHEVYLARDAEPIKSLREEAEAARAAVLAAIAAPSRAFPILRRFKINELWDASVLEPGVIAEQLFFKFRDALVANGSMAERMRQAQPVASHEPLGDREPLEATLARDYEGSVWAYGKLIDETTRALYLVPGTLGAVAVEAFMQAVAERKASDDAAATAASVGEGALSLALAAVCPPAAVALDLAYSLAETVLSISAYRAQRDEFLCTLDPADAFTDLEPSMVPVVFAASGVILSVI